MLKILVCVLAVLVGAIGPAAAQNDSVFKAAAKSASKEALVSLNNERQCKNVVPAQKIEACVTFFKETERVATQVARQYLALDAALAAHNDRDIIRTKKELLDTQLRRAELQARQYEHGVSTKVWLSVARPSLLAESMLEERRRAANNVGICTRAYSGARVAACQADWSRYAAALDELIKRSEEVNQALAAKDRERYYAATIAEVRANIEATNIEGDIKPKYR